MPDQTVPYVNGDLSLDNRVMAGSFNAFTRVSYGVENLTALRALAVPDGPINVVMRGYATAGDGGGGTFYWALGSVVADNGGTVIEPTAGTGRWIRLCNPADLNVRWFGATGDGTTYDSAAIQATIDALPEAGGSVYFPYTAEGYRINLQFDLGDFATLRFYGDLGYNGFAHDPGISTLYCKDMADYIFNVNELGKVLTIEDLTFDGRDGAAAGHANNSSTWRGVLTSVGSDQFANLFVRRCRAYGSNALFPMWDLETAFFYLFEECQFTNWDLYIIMQIAGGAGVTDTTATFMKCYFNGCRQIGYVQGPLDCQFYSCVFESSVVALAIYSTTCLLSGCYCENIGFDISGTGLSSGVTPRSFGISDSPPITGNVTAAFTQRYGLTTFLNCRFSPGDDTLYWIDGIGRAGPEAGGGIKFTNPSFAYSGSTTFFRADSDSPSSRGTFQYVYDAASWQTVFLNYADARLTSQGRFPIMFEDATVRTIDSAVGVFTVTADANGFSAIPTTYPDGGQWNLGDKVVRTLTSQAAGKVSVWECTVAGTPGSWDSCDFIPVSMRAAPDAAGTMTFGGTLENAGDAQLWEVLGTDDNMTLTYRATVAVAKLASDTAANVQEILDTITGSIALTTGGDDYVLTFTNGSGGAVNVFARLIAAYTTHT